MYYSSHLFINRSIFLLNLIYEDLHEDLGRSSPPSQPPTFYRVGMRLYSEQYYLAPEEECADTKTTLLVVTIVLLIAMIAMYLIRVDMELLQEGTDSPADGPVKDHVKDLYPNLIELAYRDRNFGARQKLSQCIRNFYQGPRARSY
ncbi:hypothetical protein BOX15_Mlig001716g4 [Macrostomum lignano]|uniref:Uncharacterized protein n=2 Tax=Macrostomum lignano TaxID=282301 RepID=A0A267G2A5_9PLAT|nr:hypothetical protein BOX15_Mlig001716g4 [Macrostomum lignano]